MSVNTVYFPKFFIVVMLTVSNILLERVCDFTHSYLHFCKTTLFYLQQTLMPVVIAPKDNFSAAKFKLNLVL